jgi:hypothetical protein
MVAAVEARRECTGGPTVGDRGAAVLATGARFAGGTVRGEGDGTTGGGTGLVGEVEGGPGLSKPARRSSSVSKVRPDRPPPDNEAVSWPRQTRDWSSASLLPVSLAASQRLTALAGSGTIP